MKDERKIKSKNVYDYMKNPDIQTSRTEKKWLLILIIGVPLAAGVISSAIIFSHSSKETASFTPAAKTEGYYDEEGNCISVSKENKKTDIDVRTVYPRYTETPSPEITSSDLLSGNIQIGEYLFTLPCKLSAFTDAGFTVDKIVSEQNMEGVTTDYTFRANARYSVVIQYDKYSRYLLGTYDREPVKILDATVVSVSQNEGGDYYDNMARPLFLPGGLHIGMDEASIYEILNRDNKLKITHGGLYTYNGPIRFEFNPNNNLSTRYDKDAGENTRVQMEKNY